MKTLSTLLLFLFIVLVGCNNDDNRSDDELSLQGTWQIISAEWNTGGETLVFPEDTFKDLRSYKFYSKSYWGVLGHVPSDSMHWGYGGKYKLQIPRYVEYIEITKNQKSIGDSVVFEISLSGDMMKISNDKYKETWKRID